MCGFRADHLNFNPIHVLSRAPPTPADTHPSSTFMGSFSSLFGDLVSLIRATSSISKFPVAIGLKKMVKMTLSLSNRY